jgi:hypothetical protein
MRLPDEAYEDQGFLLAEACPHSRNGVTFGPFGSGHKPLRYVSRY